MEKKEIMGELLKQVGNDKTILYYGTSGIANDLKKILEENEKIIMVAEGCLCSPISLLKGGKAFRKYLVLTTSRLICIENGIRSIGVVFPFLNKSNAISFTEICAVKVEDVKDVRKIFYSSLLVIDTKGKRMKICIMKKECAEKIAYLLTEFSRTTNIVEELKNVEEKEMNDIEFSNMDSEQNTCPNCGYVLKKNMLFCPNCGNKLDDKKRKKKKFNRRIVLVIGMIAIIGVAICNIDFNKTLKYRSVDSTSNQFYSLAGNASGYSEWKDLGFEGSAQLEIAVPYPVEVPNHDNYGVYMNVSRTEIGIIQQPGKEKIEDWDWINQVTEEPYDGCIHIIADFRLIGYTEIKDDKNVPVFEISNVILY